MSEKNAMIENIADRIEKYAETIGVKLNPKTRKQIGSMVNEQVHIEIDSDDAQRVGDRWNELAFGRSATTSEPPPFSVPITGNSPVIEVAPGIMVSQHLIKEVAQASAYGEPELDSIEQKHVSKLKERQEMKELISASKQVVQSMVKRAREPVNPDEKYVSYDAMPAPLQHVIKAYIDASEANKKLDEAVKALKFPSATTEG